jgi:predicted rRNA methylase YqxC with S4 and FtsJ domains
VLDEIAQFGRMLGLQQLGVIESPIVGAEGNHEYLAHWMLA